MKTQVVLNEKSFEHMEKEILDEVMKNSKDMLETFKFRMIFGMKLESSKVNKTSIGLKEFRKKNWNEKMERDEAYKKYLNLY